MTDTTPAAPQFLETREYRRFAEFCDACRQYRYIGVCHGAPGVGKTLSARHYTHWDELEPILYNTVQRRKRPAELVAWRAIVYTPTVLATPRRLQQDLVMLCQALSGHIQDKLDPKWDYTHSKPAHTELLLIDEADRLTFPAVEQVRDLYDRLGVGVVLIGMPGLEKRLSRYAQLYSRVGFVHQFRALSSVEVQFTIRQKAEELSMTLSPEDVDDAEAIAAIARITNGNFRLLQRLFSQIQRIMEVNHLTRITDDAVQAARESLVIGPT